MSRRGPRAVARRASAYDGPRRTCAGCRAHRGPEDLIRFVAGSDGELVADTQRRRWPGRGVWLCPSADCASKALKRGALGRTLRTTVRVSEETLIAQLRGALVELAAQAIRSARRAGAVDGDEESVLLAALRSGARGQPADEAFEKTLRRLRDRSESADPARGVTDLAWNARILRRFERLRSYGHADRAWTEPTSESGRRQRSGDAK